MTELAWLDIFDKIDGNIDLLWVLCLDANDSGASFEDFVFLAWLLWSQIPAKEADVRN